MIWAMPATAEEDDPMRPPTDRGEQPATAAAPSWDLTSVLISERRRLAVINDQLVRAGANVDGARVVRIEADHVVIRHAGGEQRLSLRAGLSISRSSEQ
ncbi:hypothetical protein VCB98_03885 [Gammaproteobacteria bacterium AB-CW1]|uniref:MSHA biogenesis protein MshK n=2 Tax=Natronospira TaxID=2024969 RepID=A0AAP6MM84_9GAMM|nr:hypothetical protein [Gammaproteobacteria bacterium AB-CW1]